MEGASFVSNRSIGYRPAPNDTVVPLANNNNQKSLTPILDRFKALLKEREEEIRVSSGGDDEFEVPVPSTEEIVELYEIVLSELTINSKPIITDLTIIAGEHREHGAGIADAICSRIIEAPVEHKLPSLYLVDSVVKNIGRDYIRHFSARLPEVYCLAYSRVNPNLHSSMRHLFRTWSTVFPSSILCKIESQLQFPASSNYQSSALKDSESPKPAHGIHVNPKYLEARRQLENSTTDNKIRRPRTTSTSEILEQPVSRFDEYESDGRGALSSNIGLHTLSSTNNVNRNEFDIQRPRDLIDAYGVDKRNKTTNPKVQNLSVNTWQNTEEEEFKWEDMGPTLIARGQTTGVNRSMSTKTDINRVNWSNNVVSSSDRGLKRKITDTPISHYPQETWNTSHDQPWGARQTYNSQGQRLPGVNLSLDPRLTQSNANMMTNPEVNKSTSNVAWRPSVPVPIPPSLPLNQIQGHVGRFPPQEIRPPSLGFNHSHRAIQQLPMIRGYTPQRSDASGSPFHLHGVGFPPLPLGPPPMPQSNGPTGGALSGLFTSLMAQGLLSLSKPSPEQASVGLEFDLDILKTRHEYAITCLYGHLPRQCKTCGLRFKSQEEHSSHMDWHVTKNRVSRNRKQKPSRKWFANVTMWLSSAETLGVDAVPGFLNPSEKNVVEKKDDDDMAVLADEDQNTCALCGEGFDDFYSDETEEWMYRGAVYMNDPTGVNLGSDRSKLGPIVHAKCRSESTVAPLDDFGNNGQVFIGDHMRS